MVHLFDGAVVVALLIIFPITFVCGVWLYNHEAKFGVVVNYCLTCCTIFINKKGLLTVVVTDER